MSDPKYPVGTTVVVTDIQSGGYKRRPDYLLGAIGVVEWVHGVYPDLETGKERYLYHLKFNPADVFDDPEPNASVFLDLWEDALRLPPND